MKILDILFMLQIVSVNAISVVQLLIVWNCKAIETHFCHTISSLNMEAQLLIGIRLIGHCSDFEYNFFFNIPKVKYV